MIIYQDGEMYVIPRKWLDEHDEQIKTEFAERLRVNFDLLAYNNSDEVIDYTLEQLKNNEVNK